MDRTGMLKPVSKIKLVLQTEVRQRLLGSATRAEEFGEEVSAVS